MEIATAPLDSAGTTPGSDTADSAPPESTSPRRPTDADVGLLAAAQGVELALRDLYDAALAAGADDDPLRPVLTTMRENHEEYANAISGLLGPAAPQQRNDEVYDALLSGFDQADTVAVATAAYDAESQAVATTLAVVAELQGYEGAKLVTSYLIVESEHCTVLADIMGNGDDLAALLDNTASPVALPSAGADAETTDASAPSGTEA